MRKAVALSVVVVVSVGILVFFVPVLYNPAVPPVCNFLCASSGSSPNYRSVSAQLLGQGATYWVVPRGFAQYCISLWAISSGCSYGDFGGDLAAGAYVDVSLLAYAAGMLAFAAAAMGVVLLRPKWKAVQVDRQLEPLS